MDVISESTTEAGVKSPRRFTLKDPSRYDDANKELMRPDTSLQLIIVEAIDNDMSYQIMSSGSARKCGILLSCLWKVQKK